MDANVIMFMLNMLRDGATITPLGPEAAENLKEAQRIFEQEKQPPAPQRGAT